MTVPWRRTRRSTLLAIGAAGLVVLTVLAVAAVAGYAKSRTKGQGRSPAAGSLTTSPTATPTPSPSSASPSPSPSPSSATRDVRLPDVTVTDHWNGDWALPDSFTDADLRLVNDRLSGLEGRERAGEFSEYVYAQGGADVWKTGLLLSVTGVGPGVSVTGIRADVVDRQAGAQAGTRIWFEKGEGDPPLLATLDLDGSHPSAPEFSAAPVGLPAGRTTKIEIYAPASRYTVTWDLVVEFSIQGVARSLKVDAGTTHLRTTGEAGNPGKDLEFEWRPYYRSVLYFGNSGLERDDR